jgi:hypothetical protein
MVEEAEKLLAIEEALLESMGGAPRQGDSNYWPREYQSLRVSAIRRMIRKG